MDFPNKKYDVILADPPWQYKVWSEDKKNAQGCAKRHYNTMSIEELKELPIKDLASDNCKLFLWVTPPCLVEGIKLMKVWEFEYKTIAFCWVKLNPDNGQPFFGIGHWTASNCELVLAGLKKGATLDRKDKSISQIIMSKRREHSRKPDEVYTRIEKLLGGGVSRIELFARHRRENWDSWGNQLPNDEQKLLR